LNTNFRECFSDLIKLKRLDDCGYKFHSYSPVKLK
jgi:hypothetical protein